MNSGSRHASRRKQILGDKPIAWINLTFQLKRQPAVINANSAGKPPPHVSGASPARTRLPRRPFPVRETRRADRQAGPAQPLPAQTIGGSPRRRQHGRCPTGLLCGDSAWPTGRVPHALSATRSLVRTPPTDRVRGCPASKTSAGPLVDVNAGGPDCASPSRESTATSPMDSCCPTSIFDLPASSR
jgi:hypothetical protein